MRLTFVKHYRSRSCCNENVRECLIKLRSLSNTTEAAVVLLTKVGGLLPTGDSYPTLIELFPLDVHTTAISRIYIVTLMSF